MDLRFTNVDPDGKITFCLSNSRIRGIGKLTQIICNKLLTSPSSSIFSDIGGDISSYISESHSPDTLYADFVINLKTIKEAIINSQTDPMLDSSELLKNLTPLGYSKIGRDFTFSILIENQEGQKSKITL